MTVCVPVCVTTSQFCFIFSRGRLFTRNYPTTYLLVHLIRCGKGDHHALLLKMLLKTLTSSLTLTLNTTLVHNTAQSYCLTFAMEFPCPHLSPSTYKIHGKKKRFCNKSCGLNAKAWFVCKWHTGLASIFQRVHVQIWLQCPSYFNRCYH